MAELKAALLVDRTVTRLAAKLEQKTAVLMAAAMVWLMAVQWALRSVEKLVDNLA